MNIKRVATKKAQYYAGLNFITTSCTFFTRMISVSPSDC